MTTVDYRYIYEYMRCILEDELNLDCLEQKPVLPQSSRTTVNI